MQKEYRMNIPNHVLAMSKEELNQYMIAQVQDFNDFANALSQGAIKDFAPPFIAYYMSTDDVLDFCADFFARYMKMVRSLRTLPTVCLTMKEMVKRYRGIDINFDIIKETEAVCKMITDAIEYQFIGLPSEAFEKLEKGMIADDCHLMELLPQLHVKGHYMYRVRRGTNFKERKELFHTPYELRILCDSYRFSTLGYPSLYLAGSLETALKETNVTDVGEYSCSCFHSVKPLCFIDLSLPNVSLTFWEQYSLVVFYPLIVACALKVKNPGKPFRPEYVVPQLLTQVVRLHGTGFDGISYTSTKYDVPDYRNPRQRNFVMFVPYGNRRAGYSQEVAEKMVSTSPLPCNHGGMSVDEVERFVRQLDFGSVL